MTIYYLLGAVIFFNPSNPDNLRVKEDYPYGRDKETEAPADNTSASP